MAVINYHRKIISFLLVAGFCSFMLLFFIRTTLLLPA